MQFNKLVFNGLLILQGLTIISICDEKADNIKTRL